MQPFFLQESEPRPYPLPLRLEIHACEFCPGMQAQEAFAPAAAEVLVAVNGDSCAASLHLSQLLPKLRIRRRAVEVGIPIVGHHRQNRANAEFLDQLAATLPARRFDRRTEVIETQQVLRGPGNHATASCMDLSASASNLFAQYHRNRSVLADQHDVASAIPATPSRRMNTRFNATSSTRFISPQ